jgi:hypothetical protein
MCMRYAVLLSVLIVLTGCVPDQSKDVAACVTEAERFYHMYTTVDPESPSSKFIISCMAAKGYQFTMMASDCDSRHPYPTQATCYEPTTWPSWTIDRVTRTLKMTGH